MPDLVSRRKVLPRVHDRIALGTTGLKVSPVCLGMVVDPDTVLAAFDQGVNFFFLSTDMHWPLYEGLRQGLNKLLARRRNVRDQIVVAGTCYPTQPEFTYAPFEEALQAVPRLGRFDVLVAGGAYGHEFPARQRVFRRNVQDRAFGAVAMGASFHDREAAVEAVNRSKVDLAFIRYNPAHPGARRDLFPKLRRRKARVFNFKSMVGYERPAVLRRLGVSKEHWLPSAPDYYRFALTPPAIDGILCAPQNAKEVQALVRALEAPPLDAEEERYLIDLARLASGSYQVAKP